MWLIDALTALVIVVLAHSALCRASLPLNAVTLFLISGAVVGASLVWWLLDRYGAAASRTWAAILMFAFGCEFYLFLFTMAMTSVAANLLANLARRDMTDADIEQLYDSREMVAARLDRLVAAGLLADGGAELQLTAKGQRMVSIFRRLRGFFRHPLPTPDLARQ